MKELTLTAEQTSLVNNGATAPSAAGDGIDTLLSMPLTEAKRLAAAEFERRYLIHVMARAEGSVSKGALLSGLDRTNFRRQLQRHGLR